MSILESWAGIYDVSWIPVLKNIKLEFGSHYKVVPTEGYLAWEYNPLRNYRLNQDMYEKNGKYYSKEELYEILSLTISDEKSYLENKKLLLQEEAKSPKDLDKISTLTEAINSFEIKFNDYTLREAGELVDFITSELSFNIQNPVDILPQYSYDGSVNLILNDGLNIPRLINSRFTVTGRNTYKIIDRKGDNDTNIYDQGEQFDVDTSLFKNVNKIPKLEYLGTTSGNMKVGNYHFYFKYSDADGNESDWVAESGLVSVFIGGNPNSVNTGIRDENSVKSVRFRLSNIDIGYSYVKVYYTRYSSDVDSNFVVLAKKIEKNFIINNSGVCPILITGDENETEVTLEEINSSFDVIQNAQTQCTANGRLFMANIHKSKIEYDILSKLSLCFCPYKEEEPYPLVSGGIDENYHITAPSDGYYDSRYIYDKTGYWPDELYRLGVVYVLKDGSLSPVFNIRGATNLGCKSNDLVYAIEKELSELSENKSLADVLSTIDYSEEDYMIIGGMALNENAKGVIQLADSKRKIQEPFPILGINITAHNAVIDELKKYVKGFFFVRQKRIPLTLALGLVIGLDNESRTPTIPTLGGIIDDIDHEKTFIETSDIKDINYISEGFLSRYRFSLEEKETGLGLKILKIVGIVVLIAAAVVATVFTCGAAGAAIGVGLAVAFAAGASAVGAAIGVIGIVAASVIVVAATAASIEAGVVKARLARNKRAAEAVKGRNEPIPDGYERKELKESRKLVHDIAERYIVKDFTKNTLDAVIVPDYQVNQPYYNLFLTGDKFSVKLIHEQPIYNYLTDGYVTSLDRHFYVEDYYVLDENRIYDVCLVGVPDGCPVKMIKNKKYCARAGYPEEAHKYEFVGTAYDDTTNKIANSDIIRGNFGSFVGMDGYSGHASDLISIMIPGYKENHLFEYVLLRALDTSAFYAISDRIDINDLSGNTSILSEDLSGPVDFSETYYRGDCYVCLYTHRIIRNFNDPSAPYNDDIVDVNCWRDNYNPDKTEKYAEINLGDVNAVLLGMWLTFLLRSSYNLNIRTIDKSHVDEYIMCGNHRSFYPNYGQLAVGSQKIPDSDLYNKGFTKSVSEKYYFEVPDVPYIKQEFSNRIVFSDIHINDAYKNGFRVLRAMNHKDYPMTYGSITKILELKNSLVVVFEHGVGLVSINNNSEHPSLVLSDLNIVSDCYGSLWRDSVIKTPSGIYGVDTVAKKIWRIKEGLIELISDFKVQEFLNQNITLSEREMIPILGIRNVKTFYNAFKHDIMFTFYDNLYGTSEKAWNLCWNEILGMFTTFYSWIPSELVNIDNIPFSFDRDTIKAIGKIGVSDHGNDYSDGVTLSNNVMNVVNSYLFDTTTHKYTRPTFEVSNKTLQMYYIDKLGKLLQYDFENASADVENNVRLLSDVVKDTNFIGFLHLDNRALPDGKVRYHIEYKLLRDRFGNHRIFEIKKVKLAVKEVHEMIKSNVTYVDACYLALKEGVYVSELLSELYYRNSAGNTFADYDTNKIAPTPYMYSANNRKIAGTRIKNKLVLDSLRDQYGDNHLVGNDTTLNSEFAHHCGTIGDIYEKVSEFKQVGDAEIDYDTQYHGIKLHEHWLIETSTGSMIHTNLPIFKDKTGKRLMLPKHLQVNPDKIVRYLNVKANVYIEPMSESNSYSASEAYYSLFASGDSTVGLIDAGYFESQIAITTSFNLLLLSTDFWKHGLAGLIDITDKVFPTYWYGKQHPFEFECVVVDDPSVHKIFTNLELVSNKTKPESFHYEVVGDVYDFSDDKPTMYFRQEALKALYQYNGYDIEYNPNFLEVEPKQHNRSADFPKYYSRWDSVNDIYDSYKRFAAPDGFNYDHLAGAEIVYYPTRKEFRVWNHVEAIDVDSLSQDLATSVIKANCRYLEDKWLVSINPIVVTYKNEFNSDLVEPGQSIFSKDAFGVYKYSSWANNAANTAKLPLINILGTKLEEQSIKNNKVIEFPTGELGKENALCGLYNLDDWNLGSWRPIDPTKNKDRRETDVRGKFMKVRIRYSGEELAIIDFLNTVYQMSFA